MNSKNFIEVTLRVQVGAEELVAALPQETMLGVWEQEGVFHLYWTEEQWDASVLEVIRSALKRLCGESKEVQPVVRLIPDRDWNAAWVASLRPIRIGRSVRIRQSWNRCDPEFKGIELIIDPKRAFGSGYHATTQMVIEWLEDHVRSGMQVLDIGTGSGILAMVAIRLGAAAALGIDSDSIALECARELAIINGFGPELKLQLASFDQIDPGGFDMVLANLEGQSLRRLCPLLPGFLNDGALACLSGIQRSDYDEIADLLKKNNLGIGATRERQDWLALQVRKMK